MDRLWIAYAVGSWGFAVYAMFDLYKSTKRIKISKMRIDELRRELFRQMMQIDFPDEPIYYCDCVSKKCAICRGYGIARGYVSYSLTRNLGPHEGRKSWKSDEDHFFTWADEMWEKYID